MRRSSFRLTIATCLLAVAIWAAVSWTDRSDGNDSYVREEASAIRERLRGAGAEPTGAMTIEQSAWSARAIWDCALTHTWSDFLVAVDSELRRDFQPQARTKTAAEFARYVTGDSHHLRIELVTQGQPAFIKITFTSTAD